MRGTSTRIFRAVDLKVIDSQFLLFLLEDRVRGVESPDHRVLVAVNVTSCFGNFDWNNCF